MMNPLFIFLLLFVGVPLVELYLLIKIGSIYGAIPTIFLTIFTAVLGGLMVRLQGFSTALKVHNALERNEIPAIEMIEGVMLLLCGILLLLPGFITDIVGFLCLIPQFRHALIVAFLRRSGVLMETTLKMRRTESNRSEGPKIIEGEYRREDE